PSRPPLFPYTTLFRSAGPGTMVPEALNIGVVQKIGLAFSPRAGDAEVGLDAVQEIRDASSGVSDLGSSRHAGDQSNQIREVAPVQAQVVDLLLLDVGRHSRRNRVDLRNLRLHGQAFLRP